MPKPKPSSVKTDEVAALDHHKKEPMGSFKSTSCDDDASIKMSNDDQVSDCDKPAKARFLERIMQAEHEYAAEQFSDGNEFTETMRVHYSLK